MTRDLIIFGCGGFGREVADVVDAINRVAPSWNLLGFADENPSSENVARVGRRGSQIVDAAALMPKSTVYFVVGISNAIVRARVSAFAEGKGMTPAVIIHPTAALGANLEIGHGSILGAHVCVGSDSTVGRHVHLDRNAQVGHDSKVGDFATVHPGAVISGGCIVGKGAELGTNCTLLPGISIGDNSTIGAAACVTKCVGSDVTVRGVPAR